MNNAPSDFSKSAGVVAKMSSAETLTCGTKPGLPTMLNFTSPKPVNSRGLTERASLGSTPARPSPMRPWHSGFTAVGSSEKPSLRSSAARARCRGHCSTHVETAGDEVFSTSASNFSFECVMYPPHKPSLLPKKTSVTKRDMGAANISEIRRHCVTVCEKSSRFSAGLQYSEASVGGKLGSVNVVPFVRCSRKISSQSSLSSMERRS